MFRPYEKIHRLGKDEVEGILNGTCVIQEKIDGANTSIWLNEIKDGTVYIDCASRNQQITSGGFNGFLDFLFDSPQGAGIHNLLRDHPGHVLYGEWLVKHTVQYNKEAYKNWYMFDIFTRDVTKYLPIEDVLILANQYNIDTPATYSNVVNPTIDHLKEFYVSNSVLGPVGEGIVIKNEAFINKWGNRYHAKLVRQEFLEDNAIIFNSNSKASDAYNEMYIINKYLNSARVDKVLQKLQPEINEKLDLKHIPRITNTVYYDLISEEAWEIAKLNRSIDFKKLKGLALKKSKLLYMEHLERT